ncbi:hypothetical protein ACFWGC_26010 [Cytobacillus pseudoceanisediminis]|uniref:hypothetical protein n=1 Tax=Cytobacillus pseudoceanisediminis TaxID=3051614 RepID=UPI0036678A16
MRDLKISRELAKDSSIMKIIILFGTPTETFKGNSFIILDGTVSPKSIVINSDLISHSTKDLDSRSYEKLLKEANTLEKKLEKVYKDLYKLTSFKKSLITQPFTHLEQNIYENLLLSIKNFILANEKYYDESLGSFEIAAEWMKREGIYFKEVSFTMHELAVTIQYYRNNLIFHTKIQ